MSFSDQQLTNMVLAIVECATGRHRCDLSGTTRGVAAVARARQVAMYLSHVGLSLSLSRVGEVFGRDKSTVAHAVQQIEDLRDDAEFDGWLSGLEESLGALSVTTSRSGKVLSGVWKQTQDFAGKASASA